MSITNTPGSRTAALLIAHGSRREAANQDLSLLAEAIRARGEYPIVEIAYLELAAPTIPDAGRACVEQGAGRVLMLPYFLSAGRHVADDLARFRTELAGRFPAVPFVLCQSLSLHPLLIEVVLDRLREAKTT